MRAYMAEKADTIATLRCLGATAPQVLTIYLLQAAAMGLAGAALGVVIGSSVQWVLLLRDLLPVEVNVTLSAPALLTGRAGDLDRACLRADPAAGYPAHLAPAGTPPPV